MVQDFPGRGGSPQSVSHIDTKPRKLFKDNFWWNGNSKKDEPQIFSFYTRYYVKPLRILKDNTPCNY